MSDTVTNAIVKGTFALLLLGSVLTWSLVLVKARQRLVTRSRDRRFLGALGASPKLAALKALRDHDGPAWRLSQAALSAVADRDDLAARESEETPREAVERALVAQIAKERRASEAGLAVLASVGSTAPFVGLFGTVWGIIHALRAIGSSGSASLEVVAGPIGEALVATGVGIAVAVPAVLAYNFFVRRLKVQLGELELLAARLVALVGRARPVANAEASLRAPRDARREASV
jgi:biopolymer transport protein ExbB